MSVPNDSWNPDEIPGHTTFLYNQNRFREPHEFINTWKFQEKADNRRRQLGLPADASVEDLLDRIQSLEYRLEEADMTPQLNRLTNEIDQIKAELKLSREMASGFKKKNDVLELDKTGLAKALEQKKAAVNLYTEQLIKYGEHHADCNIVDALESGRMLDKSEKDACTCGWTSDKLAVLEINQK